MSEHCLHTGGNSCEANDDGLNFKLHPVNMASNLKFKESLRQHVVDHQRAVHVFDVATKTIIGTGCSCIVCTQEDIDVSQTTGLSQTFVIAQTSLLVNGHVFST